MAINVQNELIFGAKPDELEFELTMGIVGVKMGIGVTVGVLDSQKLRATNIDSYLGGMGWAVWFVMDIRCMPLFSEQVP